MLRQSVTLQLFLSHRAELVNYAARILGDRERAEDVVQEAWLRVRATDRPIEEPIGFLRRIVRNLALDGRRRQSLETRLFVENAYEAVTTVGDDLTPEVAAMANAELRLVLGALAEMPERMRIAVEMHRIEGAKLKEIAAHLGISVTTAHELVAEGVSRCRAAARRRN